MAEKGRIVCGDILPVLGHLLWTLHIFVLAKNGNSLL